MHLYCNHIVSGIFLILPIINFAVAAPVLVQEKLQARVDVVHIPKHAVTMLGKRAGELDEILWDAEGHYFVRPEYSAKPGESSATRPSSGSRPSGLGSGPTDVEQPQPSIPEQPSQVSSLHSAPLSASDEEWLNLKLGQAESHLSPNPNRAPQSASDEWLNLNLNQAESHFSPNPDRAPLSADESHGLMKMWLNIIGHPESATPEELSVAHTLLSLASGSSTDSGRVRP
jgi:hypothetical protein